MWSSFYRSRKRALLIRTGPMIGVLFRHDWTLLWLSLIQSLSHKSENPEVCWSPERRELNQTTEILLLIYSFCCVDFICNQLSWKSDSGCLIRTTNIVRGNKEAAENTWSPCFKSHHTSCRVIKLTLAWEEAADLTGSRGSATGELWPHRAAGDEDPEQSEAFHASWAERKWNKWRRSESELWRRRDVSSLTVGKYGYQHPRRLRQRDVTSLLLNVF